MPGADEVLVAARSALLDALVALGNHADEITLIGAQAIYLHTGAADVALAETTKDSDLVVDPPPCRSERWTRTTIARSRPTSQDLLRCWSRSFTSSGNAASNRAGSSTKMRTTFVGDPDIVAQSVSILAADLTTAITSP